MLPLLSFLSSLRAEKESLGWLGFQSARGFLVFEIQGGASMVPGLPRGTAQAALPKADPSSLSTLLRAQ